MYMFRNSHHAYESLIIVIVMNNHVYKDLIQQYTKRLPARPARSRLDARMTMKLA